MRIFVFAMAVAVLTCGAWGQTDKNEERRGILSGTLGKVKDLGKKKPDAPPAESALDDKSDDALYREIDAFAEGLYSRPAGSGNRQQAPAFKRHVDGAYEDLKRKHAERAYQVNLSARSNVVQIIEDRFRVFSGLYDNVLVQDLANRTGHSAIPPKMKRLFTFKLLADPVPRAEALSTGTIYVTTGLASLLNTKAELAYVLAHEAAHAHLEHYKKRIMHELAAEEYARQQRANSEAFQRRLALIGGIAGATLGAVAGKSGDAAVTGGVLGLIAGGFVGGVMTPERKVQVDWNRIEEDEADHLALQWLMERKLNVHEVPKVYLALQHAGDHDDRVTLGFLGRADRLKERLAKVESFLADAKKKPGFDKIQFLTTDPDFEVLMAEVKRDNGVLAFHHDMLEVARDNLEKAVAVKTQDPTALYFYAKILKQTARDDNDRKKAVEYFKRAADNDHRNLNYGAHLHRAVAMLTPDATAVEKRQAVEFLKKYLESYYLSALEKVRAQSDYPPHLETVYDYMTRLGEFYYKFDGDQVKAALKNASQVKTVEMAPSPVAVPVATEPEEKKPEPKRPASRKSR